MEFSSQKGKRQISLDGFIYRCDKTLKNGVESWRCLRKKCGGRIHIKDGQVDSRGQHNHEPNLLESEVKQCLSRIRQRASTSQDKPGLLIKQEQAVLSPEAIIHFPKYAAAQRMINRKRKSETLEEPRAADVVELDVVHRLAESVKEINRKSENTWTVPCALNSDKEYVIKKLDKKCDKNCKVTCGKCNFCIHTYSCTCLEFLTHAFDCKHIHAVHMEMNSVQDIETNHSESDTEYLKKMIAEKLDKIMSLSITTNCNDCLHGVLIGLDTTYDIAQDMLDSVSQDKQE